MEADPQQHAIGRCGPDRHLRRGSVRSDISPSVLAQMVLALITGDVAQRFVARERTLTESPVFIDAMVRLLSRT